MLKIREAEQKDLEGLLVLARQTFVDAFGRSMNSSDLAAHLAVNLSSQWLDVAWREDTFLVAWLGSLEKDAVSGAQQGP